MTQQIHGTYRRHRKGTWGLALLLALVVAAIVSPFASGGGNKTYSIGLNPASQCASSTDGATSTVVTLKDTSNSQGLGSAELLFPAGSVYSTSLGTYLSNQSGTPYDAGTADVIGPLNNLNLSPGGSVNITVTFKAGSHTGPVEAVVKQANQFNDNVGTANLFTNPTTWPQLNVATCHYAFTQQPVDAQTNAAQTVKVQLLSDTTPVAVSGPLTLGAVENGTPGTPGTPGTSVGSFTGLTSSGQDSTNTWVFNSVTGSQSGTNYELVAGSGATQTVSNSFDISDCNLVNGSCTSAQILNGDGSGGGQASGTGITSGFDLQFAGALPDTGKKICTNQGWQEMTFPPQPPDERTTFDGITTTSTSYQSNTGYLLVTLYFLNSLYVQTSASQTNNIQICAGAHHTVLNNDGSYPWMAANNVAATYDPITGDYWGVLQRISNCNANKIPVNNGIKSPALCAWGTVTINGLSYRSATMIVPYDWDYQGKG
jgi:hypothetical protein